MAYDRKYGQITAEHGDVAHGEAGVPLNSSDEPVFVIRAQDISAVVAIKAYFVEAAIHGATFDYDTMVSTVEEFQQWQADHPELVKIPD